MFILFSKEKLSYSKAQVFPFLIAVIVVVIIMIMITVNLGQISIFRTDVSNAADAGALAAASVLSQTLLGLGIKSDQMMGVALIAAIVATIWACNVITYGKALAALIALMVKQLVTFWMATAEAKMGWANAKKTALQYALNNAGVDEPRPSFRQYVYKAYGVYTDNLGLTELKRYYDEYLKGGLTRRVGGREVSDPVSTERARRFGENGFSHFMEHYLSGFASEIGEISPSMDPSKPLTYSEYGWTQTDDEFKSFCNSYGLYGWDNQKCASSTYDNYVKVRVEGASGYPLRLSFFPVAGAVVFGAIVFACILSKLGWYATLYALACGAIFAAMVCMIPAGLTMDMKENTDDNPVRVTVWRTKKASNVGFWRFNYGTVSAQATSRAYRGKCKHRTCRGNGDGESIEPAFIGDLGALIRSKPTQDIWEKDGWGWFDTNKHLFETEIIFTH